MVVGWTIVVVVDAGGWVVVDAVGADVGGDVGVGASFSGDGVVVVGTGGADWGTGTAAPGMGTVAPGTVVVTEGGSVTAGSAVEATWAAAARRAASSSACKLISCWLREMTCWSSPRAVDTLACLSVAGGEVAPAAVTTPRATPPVAAMPTIHLRLCRRPSLMDHPDRSMGSPCPPLIVTGEPKSAMKRP